MRAYQRLALILLAALAVGVTWYAVARPRPVPVGPSGLKYDPIEDDDRMKPILEAVDREVDAIKAKDPPEVKAQLGYCFHIWGVKKSLLREKHGIVWRTPAEMNPDVVFD